MKIKMQKNKGQISPFMVGVVAILILAITATLLLGEFAYQKVRIMTTVDSALISSATRLARALNMVRQYHFRMLLNYIRVQTMLLAAGIWPSKAVAVVAAMGYAQGIITSAQMYSQAKKIVENVTDNTRKNLFERILGSLIDEPVIAKYKPLNVKLSDGQEIVLDSWDIDSDQESPFVEKFRDFKKNVPGWAGNNMLSYSWNRRLNSDKNFIEGNISIGEPLYERAGKRYDAYASVTLNNVPTHISIRPQRMILFFIWWCNKSICPGFLPHPWAWISSITISPSNTFGVNVKKRPFRTFAYFISENTPEEKKVITHNSTITITGNVWSGYDIKLQE